MSKSNCSLASKIRGKIFVLVGGLGFIGGHLAKNLLDKGAIVYVIDIADPANLDEKHRYNFDLLSSYGSSVFKPCLGTNITDRRALKRQVKANIPPCYCAVNMAALSGARGESNIDYELVNVGGTKNVISLLVSQSQHFINFSSSNVYGNNSRNGIPEFERLMPVNPYGRSKMKAERLCEELIEFRSDRSIGLKSIVNIRPFNIYGNNYKKGAAIYDFISNIYRGQPSILYNGGSNIRSYTHVDDLVRIINAILLRNESIRLEYGLVDYETFNIGSDDHISTDSLIRLIYSLMKSMLPNIPKLQIEYGKSPVQEIEKSIPDNTKVKNMLGITTYKSLTEGLVEYISWWVNRIKRFEAKK